MRHRWETIAFLHWSYPVEEVQQLLPDGLSVEPWRGQAWVGLVPFRMRIGAPFGPELPGISPFPETNVRTYVVGPDGRPGVWFFSLDAGSLSAVGAARASWQLPYFWADMAVHSSGGTVSYRSRRRWPSPRGVGHDIRVAVRDEVVEPGEFEHYLTARFTLWNVAAGRLMRTQAEHPPWVLRSADVDVLEQDLLGAAGLTPPVDRPLVHFSDGVDVRIGAPRLVRRLPSADASAEQGPTDQGQQRAASDADAE